MDLADPRVLYDASAYTLAHNGLLRGGELWSGILVEDFSWNLSRTSFDLSLHRTKTHLTGGVVKITLHSFRGPGSCVRLLKQWFDLFDLWSHPSAFVFPRWTRDKSNPFNWKVNGSKWSWVQRFRIRLNDAGLSPLKFSGHSFRPGGATDLFTMKVPLATVMKVGRWKSPDSALVYFREENEIAAAAASAFGKCYRS